MKQLKKVTRFMSEKYYFAKLNVNQNLFNSSINFNDIKQIYIPEQIRSFNDDRSDKRFCDKKTNSEWTITDVKNIDENIIYGRLSKITQPKDSFKIVKGNKTTKDLNKIAYVSDFYYFIKQEYIVFNTNIHIKYQTFVSIFGKVLYNCGNKKDRYNMGNLEIRLLTEVSEFQKELFNNSVFHISLDYVAPNDPNTIDKLANIFKDSKSESGKLELNNRSKGIEIKQNSLIKNMMFMLKQGWASITAEVGKKYKNRKSISTTEYPLKTKNCSELSENDKINYIRKEVDKFEKERNKSKGDNYQK